MADPYRLLFLLGRPLSPLYGLAMRLRGWLYRRNLLRRTRLPVPVISVGNLAMGGSGKTPMVIFLARWLQESGRRLAVVSRGYGGQARGRVNVVSDGSNLLLEAAQAGDEPRLLAESLPGVPVLTGRQRQWPAQAAVDLFGAEVIVLDDGFQHLALDRNLDLVLFHARSALQAGRVFPGGELREPFAALRRAQAVVVTGLAPETEGAAASFEHFLKCRYPDLPVFRARYRPVGLVAPAGCGQPEEEEFRRLSLFAFCAIATPASFQATLEQEGYRLGGFRGFPDHHAYTTAELQGLVAQARAAGCRGLVTTEKDLVKIPSDLLQDFPVYALRVELSFGADFESFLRRHFPGEQKGEEAGLTR